MLRCHFPQVTHKAETRHLLVTQIGPSVRCSHDLTTFWDKKMNRCRPCKEFGSLIPGYEYSPNCGRDDHSGTQDVYQVPCPRGTYNDGKNTKCLKCTDCPPEKPTAAECSGTVDSQCCGIGDETRPGKTHPSSTLLSRIISEPTAYRTLNSQRARRGSVLPLWGVQEHLTQEWNKVSWLDECRFLCFLRRHRAAAAILSPNVCGTVLTQRSQQPPVMSCAHFLPFPAAPSVEKAPVSVVLDDLDVLEELVMLLDPDRPGAKSTRHVAARCGFSATWVNYAYSMRESRSPLKAVLEGVTAKFPEWTVGDLARVLGETGRNDAVAVLSKLPPPPRSGAAENRPPVAGSPPPERTPLTCHYGR
ncbi:IGF-like family receptor 1 [Arapaima gigas]